MKTKNFTVNVRVKAIVSFDIKAESLEDAIVQAREEVKKTKFIDGGVEHIDGSEEIIGVDAPWELE